MGLQFVSAPNSDKSKRVWCTGEFAEERAKLLEVDNPAFSTAQGQSQPEISINKDADSNSSSKQGTVDLSNTGPDLSPVPVPDLSSQTDLMNMYNARVQGAQDTNAQRAVARSTLADMTNLQPTTSITGLKMWKVPSKTE